MKQTDPYQQNAVSATVWPWAQRASGREAPSLAERLAASGNWAETAVHAAVALVVGWWLFYSHYDKPVMAYLIWGVSGTMVFGLFFLPPLHRALKRGLAWFGAKAALGVTWLLLVPFFYLVFCPGRLVQKLLGRDPMHRKFPTQAPTYWIPRLPVRSIEQYRKQH